MVTDCGDVDPMMVYPIDKINILEPAFDAAIGYGWISIAELNLLDPNVCKYAVVCDMTFETGDIFMLVEPVQ